MSSKETEEALKFVNKHTNPKTAINGRGFRKSKGQKVQEANVDQLEKKLLASKQRVVLHLRDLRAPEVHAAHAHHFSHLIGVRRPRLVGRGPELRKE